MVPGARPALAAPSWSVPTVHLERVRGPSREGDRGGQPTATELPDPATVTRSSPAVPATRMLSIAPSPEAGAVVPIRSMACRTGRRSRWRRRRAGDNVDGFHRGEIHADAAGVAGGVQAAGPGPYGAPGQRRP